MRDKVTGWEGREIQRDMKRERQGQTRDRERERERQREIEEHSQRIDYWRQVSVGLNSIFLLWLCCDVMSEQRLALRNNLCWLNLLNFTVLNTNKEHDIYFTAHCLHSDRTTMCACVCDKWISIYVKLLGLYDNTIQRHSHTVWSCRNYCIIYICIYMFVFANYLLIHTFIHRQTS